MSAKNFYQAFYQNDQLFRLANELWTPETQSVATSSLADHESNAPANETRVEHDLLAELDALSIRSDVVIAAPEASATPAFESKYPTYTESEIDSAISAASPEPLPQVAVRPTAPPVIPAVQQPRLPQLNHKVLILADEELDPSNLLFLEKILKAINLNIDGVDLLNLHGAGDLDFAALVEDKKIHHFITFGVPFSRIHLDIAMDRYHPIRFFGITFLMADSLPTIEADQNLKKRLWGALQRIFLLR